MFSWFNLRNNSKTKILELEQKISEQDNILNHVTHEIRTSIHGGSSIAQFLYENWDKMDEQEHVKYVSIIAKNNQRLIKLINDLLDLSKFSTGKMQFNFVAMDLLSSIKETVQQLTELNIINDRVNIILIDHSITKAMINGDKIRINQLLNNLFNNALKYTKEGLIIAVIDLKNHDNIPYWCFSLIDTGIGIPDSELETIFEVFTILFVDDEPICHDAINLVLHYEQKYKIISAYSGQEAVNLFKIYANIIELIFLDISLPDMTGYEVHKQIRSDDNLAHIPIIFQTGFSSNHQEMQEFLQEQTTYLIHKPYKNEELLETIRQFHN